VTLETENAELKRRLNEDSSSSSKPPSSDSPADRSRDLRLRMHRMGRSLADSVAQRQEGPQAHVLSSTARSIVGGMRSDKLAMEPVDMALVERYAPHPDWRKYVLLTTAASDAGNDWATYIVATWFLRGFQSGRIAIDRPRAVRLLKKASRSSPHAMVELAHCYEDGDGVRRSPARARDLLTKAAEFGSVFALLHLAWIYGEGVGVRANPGKARRLVKQACRSGLTVDPDGDLALTPSFSKRTTARKRKHSVS
jgi:TPR repeat protein